MDSVLKVRVIAAKSAFAVTVVRSGRWKLVLGSKAPRGVLFHDLCCVSRVSLRCAHEPESRNDLEGVSCRICQHGAPFAESVDIA